MNTRQAKIQQPDGEIGPTLTSAPGSATPQIEQLDLCELSTSFVRQACAESLRAATRLNREIAAQLSRFAQLGSSLECSMDLTCPSLQSLAGLENLPAKTNRDALLARSRYELIEQLATTSICPVLDDCLAQASILVEQNKQAREEVARLTQKCRELGVIAQEAQSNAAQVAEELKAIHPSMVIQHHQKKAALQLASRKSAERAAKLAEKESLLRKAAQKLDVLTPQLKEQFEALLVTARTALRNFTDQVNSTPPPKLVIPEKLAETLARVTAQQKEAEVKAALEEARHQLYQALRRTRPFGLGCRTVFNVIEVERPSDLNRFFQWLSRCVDRDGWHCTLKDNPDFRSLGPRIVKYCLSLGGALEINAFLTDLEKRGLLKLSKAAGEDCQRELKRFARGLHNVAEGKQVISTPVNPEEALDFYKASILMHAVSELMPTFMGITEGKRIGLATAFKLWMFKVRHRPERQIYRDPPRSQRAESRAWTLAKSEEP